MDTEWKEQVLEKLGKVDELVVQVWRVVDALEKLAGIESQNSDEGQISWPKSKREETEVQKSTKKRKQREQRSSGAEEGTCS